jgi:hypothetical protein
MTEASDNSRLWMLEAPGELRSSVLIIGVG